MTEANDIHRNQLMAEADLARTEAARLRGLALQTTDLQAAVDYQRRAAIIDLKVSGFERQANAL